MSGLEGEGQGGGGLELREMSIDGARYPIKKPV